MGENSKTSDEALFQSIWPTTKESSENVRENVTLQLVSQLMQLHAHNSSLKWR